MTVKITLMGDESDSDKPEVENRPDFDFSFSFRFIILNSIPFIWKIVHIGNEGCGIDFT